MDSRLPQLDRLLNGTLMIDALQSACLREPWTIHSCKVGHVRYSPGKKCLIRYDATLRGVQKGQQQIWYGLAFEPGTSASRWVKAQAANPAELESGPGVAHLEQLGMVLWAFPNDRKLRHLDVLFDCQLLSRQIFGCQGAVQSSDLVRYIPEHGCTAKVRTSDATYYAKIHTGDAARMLDLSRQLGREAWFEPVHGIGVQREIAGCPARGLENGVEELDACAVALARLHRTALTGLPDSPTDDGLDRAAMLLAAYPGAVELADSMRNLCEPSGHTATLHGDPHLKNFLIRDHRAELIDLDTLRRGDPVDDLASFAASILHQTLAAGGDLEAARTCLRKILATYHRHAHWVLREEDVALRIARVLLVERATRSITRCKRNVVDGLVALAQHLLHTRRIESTDPHSARDWMHHFRTRARARPEPVTSVHYKTYVKPSSWARSSVTVGWRGVNEVEVARLGGNPATWTLPQDPAMPWLATLTSSAAVLPHLPLEHVRSVSIAVLNYRPGIRLTARYSLVTSAGERTLYGKTYPGDHGAQLLQWTQLLRDQGMRVSEPLGFSPAVRTYWQNGFNGKPVHECAGLDWVPDAMRQLFLLHRSTVPCPARPSPAEQLVDLTKKLNKVCLAAPDLADRSQAMLRWIRGRMVSAGAPHVIHGDFHLRQMKACEGDVALFDFDELAIGDPEEDLANFVADLHGTNLPLDRIRTLADAMIEQYQVRAPISADRLRWYSAIHFLTRAYRALLQLSPDFDSRVRHFLQLTEALQ
jgi:aminoglycoside phosphotransferase (APT) family kinase protein